jgi:hypothetical protein
MKQDSRNKGREIEALLLLRERSPDAFMKLFLETIKQRPELAVDDSAPAEIKLRALEKMRLYFEKREEYEECAFIKQIGEKIKDGSKE